MLASEGVSTGRTLFTRALAGATQALARPIGAIEPGRRADIVLLDAEHPDLAGDGDRWLDGWIFVAGRAAVKSVLVGGDTVVQDGRHRLRPSIEAGYKSVMRKLMEV